MSIQLVHHDHIAPQPINQNRTRSPSSDQIVSPSSSSSSTYKMTNWIHAGHYQILMNGDRDTLTKETILNHFTEFDNSSALHIAAMAGQDQLILAILTRFDIDSGNIKNILISKNSNGDLPIHVAVRAGKIRSVYSLLGDCVPSAVVHQMLEEGNNDDNTPLHIALENQQKDMSDFLFKKCPHTFHCLNRLGISPLYLAIKAGFWELVKSMLQTNVEGEDHANVREKLDKGKVVHAAIMAKNLAGFWELVKSMLQTNVEGEDHANVREKLDKGKVVHAAIMAKNLEILKIMLSEYPELRYSSDEKLRRPLSYAAFTGFIEGVEYLLSKFRNLSFRPDEDGSFPIHRACSGGSIQVLDEFLVNSNNMMWLLNPKGQNILHAAAESGKAKVVNYILRLSNSEDLINMKDEDGNTPLHLASKGKHPKIVYVLTWDDRVKLDLQNKRGLTALDIAEDYGQVPSFKERLTWLALTYAGVPRAPPIYPPAQETGQVPVPDQAPNNLYYIPVSHDMIHDQLMIPSNKYKDRLNALLVVSTLVATVTFASGFTVPGGYNQSNPNIGMAVLAHKWAFQVYVISNTIALYSAILATVTLIWAQLDDLRLTLLSLDFALPLLGTALTMMSVAFMAGLFVVLRTQLWLSVLVSVIGGGFLGIIVLFFIPFYSPTSHIKSKLWRCIFQVPFKLMLHASEKGESRIVY